ncbi:uncharacterized protein LOC101850284 [Aplysia californica]|uniref:Uncharacterized protein LOC101850284 n=1 Tax=Aplysia californica TaxID=6500 RepID=A0ABM0K5N5_APLCA|nr:uncharacterized protein LOC101850284 [Aplysia californica]
MIRRHKAKPGKRGHQQFAPDKRESSRLSPVVLSNPVNQAAHWSQESYLLEDLQTQYPLPQVVRCSSRLVPGEEHALPVNVHVPMLLCNGRSARKLLAKHVGNDTRSQILVETDDSIVIPGDYDGNFLRLHARTTQDKSVARSLHDVANSQIPAFVNFSTVTSYTYVGTNGLNGDSGKLSGSTNNVGSEFSSSHVSSRASKISGRSTQEQQKRIFHPPGSVFVVTGTSRGKAKNKRWSRDVLLIRCSDEHGNEVLIPSDQPGEVVEVETPPPGSTKLSLLPKDLMASNRYPGLVRFVYGHHPPRLTPCSNMFTLIDTFEESSLIGCLLYPNHALMIELPMTSSLGFQVALNKEELLDMHVPRQALNVVKTRSDTFMRDLKLKCKFLHRVSPSLAPNLMGQEGEDDMPSATVRTRQYANEAFFYL